MAIGKNKVFVLLAHMLLIMLVSCGGGGEGGISSGSIDTPTLHEGSLTLKWEAPITNSNGTSLTDLAGYRIYFGTSPGNYSLAIDIGNVTTYTIENLSPGIYYFAIAAYDTSGNESTFSNEVSAPVT